MASHNLQIPEAHRPAFATLLTYEPKRLETIFSVLTGLSTTLFVRSSARALARKADLPEKEALQLLTVFASLFSLRDHPGISETELPDQILKALEADSETDLPNEKKAFLRNFLSRILTLGKTLGVTAKAWTIAREFERTYCYSRTVTDMRAVFVPDSDEPAAVVICHNLKLAYHDEDDVKEFFVALSPQDLAELKKVIERAMRKEEKLQAIIATTNLPLLKDDRDA